jgi:hypothetical protein
MPKKQNNYKSYSNLSINELHKLNLSNIKNCKQLNEYIRKTGDILEEYYKGENSEELKHQYLMLTDINYRIKHSKVEFDINCNNCNISRLYIPEEGRYVCTNCGETEYVLTDLGEYSGPLRYKKYMPYTIVTYVKERLKQFKCIESTQVPDDVISIIKAEFYRRKIQVAECTVTQLRKILKILKLQKYYQNIYQIYCNITGKQAMFISQQVEETLIHMFKQIKPLYEKLCPNRIKFLSYSYVLNKLFNIINMPDVASYFPQLKNKKHLREHDIIFRQICKQLHWRFST